MPEEGSGLREEGVVVREEEEGSGLREEGVVCEGGGCGLREKGVAVREEGVVCEGGGGWNCCMLCFTEQTCWRIRW